MALKGNLRDVGLNQLFNLVHLAHKTGALTIQNDNGTQSACLFFKEGRMIQAGWVGSRAPLTDVLVQAGKITPVQAQAVRARARSDTDKELGLLMIQGGVLSQQAIVQGVKGHFLETVYQLFAWPGGTFRFEPNQLPAPDRITVAISLDHLIIEGGHRVQELERLRDELPNLDLALAFAERPGTNLHSINLTVEQWKVVSFINSRNTIRQIGNYLKLDEFNIRRVVEGLRSSGLVDLVAAPQPPPRPAPVAAALRPAVALAGAGTTVPARPAAPQVSRNVIMRVISRLLGF